MKVVINRCFGGFWLSDKACERLIELGWKWTTYNKKGGLVDETAKIVKSKPRYEFEQKYYCGEYNLDRTDVHIVQVVEELGEAASGRLSKLDVVEIPDGIEYEINNYDGMESIHEKHRSWG